MCIRDSPDTRRYRLVMHGLDSVCAVVEGVVLAEADAGPLTVELGAVPTASGASVHLTGQRRASDNHVESRSYDLLAAAQIEFQTKDAVWSVLQNESHAARRVADLQAMDLPAALFAALCELLLADA